jgi:hypothetical protein
VPACREYLASEYLASDRRECLASDHLAWDFRVCLAPDYLVPPEYPGSAFLGFPACPAWFPRGMVPFAPMRNYLQLDWPRERQSQKVYS